VAWGWGLCQANERLAEKLVEALRDSVAVHADGTGWRVGGQNGEWRVASGEGSIPYSQLATRDSPWIGAGPMRWEWRSWRGCSRAWRWLTGDAPVAN